MTFILDKDKNLYGEPTWTIIKTTPSLIILRGPNGTGKVLLKSRAQLSDDLASLCEAFIVRSETCKDYAVAKSWAKAAQAPIFGALWKQNEKGYPSLTTVAILNEGEDPVVL